MAEVEAPNFHEQPETAVLDGTFGLGIARLAILRCPCEEAAPCDWCCTAPI